MKTRELNKAEKEIVYDAWQLYLKRTDFFGMEYCFATEEHLLDITNREWNNYTKTLDDNGIIGTLGGYRKLLGEECVNETP